MTEPRRRGWLLAPAVIAALVAAFAVALFTVRSPPAWVLRVLGVDGEVDLQGGLRIAYRLDAGTPEEQIEEIRGRLGTGRVDGDVVILTYPGQPESALGPIVASLTRTLRFQVVDNGAPFMRDLFARAERDPEAASLGVKPETDAWTPESGGQQIDYYLRAADRAVLEGYVALVADRDGLRVPADRELGYEHVQPWPDAEDPSPYWRTYFLERAVALDGRSIASGAVSYDPQTGQPLVLVDFTREGGRRFGEVTAAAVGKKIATSVGDDVVSAPIINQAIRGGRASITMGGSTAQQQEDEARALVANLQVSWLPPGQVIDARYLPPTVTASTIWLARALCGLALGLLAFVGVALAGRRSECIPGYPGAATRPAPWGRLLVTLGVGVAVYLTTRARLPGLDHENMEAAGIDPDMPALGSFMLGVLPLLQTFVIVEVVAALAPGLRRLRVTPDGRRKLGRVVAVGAIALAAVQAWFAIRYLVDMSESPYGTRFVAGEPLVMVASVVAATAWLAWLAGIASEHGLGNGYSTILASAALIGIGRELWLVADGAEIAVDMSGGEMLILGAFGAAAAAALAIWLVTRRFVASATSDAEAPRIAAPVAGIAPFAWGIVISGVFASLGSMDIWVPYEWVEWLSTMPASTLLPIAIALTPALGWLLSRPGAITSARARMLGIAAAPAHRAWLFAVAASAGLVVAIAAAALGMPMRAASLDILAHAVVAVVVLDFVASWRAHRRADLVGVWPIHQFALADVAVEVLAKHGIAAHLRGRHHRALLHVFGPFVPIEVMVPADRAGEATALLRDLFDPAARGSTTAW
jgi:hypothetical protein